MSGYNLPPGCIWPSDVDYYMAMERGGRYITCPACDGEASIIDIHEHNVNCPPECPTPEGATIQAVCVVCSGDGRIDREDFDD